MSAFYVLKIIIGTSLWTDVMWLPNMRVVKSSETFVVTVCCSDLMGQLSSETAGLPITGRTGN